MAKIEQDRPEDITVEELKGVLSFLNGARGVIKAGADSYVAHKYTERIDTTKDVLSGVKSPEMQVKVRNKIVDTFVSTPEGSAELKAQKLYNDDGSINYEQAYTYLRRSKKVSNKDVVYAINSEEGLIDAGKAAAKHMSKESMNTVGLWLFGPNWDVRRMRALSDIERTEMGSYPEYLLSQLSSVYKYGNQYPSKAELENAKRVAETNRGNRNPGQQANESETTVSVRPESEATISVRPESETTVLQTQTQQPQTPIQPSQNPIQGTLNFDATPAQMVPPRTSDAPQTATEIKARGVENQFEGRPKTAEQTTVERAEQIAAQHRAKNTPINAEFD